jgi:type III secretion protein T
MNFFDQLAGFAFCMIRPSVALSLVPFGNDGALGVTLRVPLVLTFAALPGLAGWPPNPLHALALEVLIGLALGLLLGVIFHTASAAGAIIDQQGGYSIGAVYDPNFQQESSLFETLFTQFAALTFFTGPGLVRVCGFFSEAWQFWPPGSASHGGLTRLLTALAETRLPWAFTQGLQLAAPLLGLMLITDLAMGLASRHAKRLNPFSTARTLKVMILSFAAMASVPALLERLARIAVAALNVR